MLEQSNLELGISPKEKSIQNAIATLYLKKTTIGPKIINTIVHIKNLLQLKGIFEDEIEEVLLSDGEKMKAMVEKNDGKDEFPIVFIQDVCIGTVNDFRRLGSVRKIRFSARESVYNAASARNKS